MPIFLKLGEVTFADWEIPEHINFGGAQSLAVKKLVGGKRKIDAMGCDDDDITWSGVFLESTAQYRAQFLDGMRRSGLPYPLSWSIFNYSVVIKDFRCSFERTYQIPYTITCTVVEDSNKPLSTLLPVAYNDAILGLLTEANDLAVLISNPSVTTAMALVSATLLALPSIQDATNIQLIPAIVAIADAQAVVDTAIITASSRIF